MSSAHTPKPDRAGDDDSPSPMENPYAPPAGQLEVNVQLAEAAYPAASTGKRFCNYLIDRLIAVGGMPVLVGLVIGMMERLGIVSGWVAHLQEAGVVEDFAFGAFLSLFYFAGMEGLAGVTIGKLVTGCKVISNQGTRPRFSQVLGRTLARFVPFEPFSFLGGNPSGWHDRWSNTCVVDVRAGRKALAQIRGSV